MVQIFYLTPCWAALLVAAAAVAGDGPLEAAGKTIREIRIEGLQHTREALVRAQLTSRVGEPYRPETAELDRERLDRLAVFSEIEIEPKIAGGEVIVHISIVETSRYVPFPAFAINDENGLSLGGGVRATSLMGRAVAASADLRFGGQDELELLLDSPWGLRDRYWYAGEYHYRSRVNDLDHFDELANEGEIRGGLQVGHSLRLGARFEFLTVKTEDPGVTLNAERSESTPGLGFVAAYDTRDQWSDPHRGWENFFTIMRHGGFLGGAGDFLKTTLDVRRWQPLSERNTLVAFSFTTFHTGQVGVDIPIYRDVHIGGTNSIRGWKDLSARNGKNQFINTLEYRYDLVKPRHFRLFGVNLYGGLKLAAFGDIGTAWSAGPDFTRNFIGGVGIGLRVVIPYVQIVRLDLAFGERGAGLVPHFSIRDKSFYHRQRVR